MWVNVGLDLWYTVRYAFYPGGGHVTRIVPFLVALMMGSTALSQSTAPGSVNEVDEESSVPWSITLDWDHSVTVRTFSKKSQLSYDPHYIWWFEAYPRYKINDRWSIGARARMNYELTQTVDSEFNRPGFYGRQIMWGDIRFDGAYTWPIEPAGFKIKTAFDLRLPTSQFSRARKRILSPGIRLSAKREFDHIAKGLTLSAGAAYWAWFARSNVAVLDDFPCRVAPSSPGEGFSSSGCLGAGAAGVHNVSPSAKVAIKPHKRLSLSLAVAGWWVRASNLKEGCVDTLTGPVCVGDTEKRKHWRPYTNFALGVSYDITDYLVGSLTYDTWAGYPDSDGSVENPIYNENTRFILGFSLSGDALYTHIRDKKKKRETRTPLAKK